MSKTEANAPERAAKAQKALDRAADGAKAKADYDAERLASEANTVRLRALRLEKEDAERKRAAAPAPKTAKVAKVAKVAKIPKTPRASSPARARASSPA